MNNTLYHSGLCYLFSIFTHCIDRLRNDADKKILYLFSGVDILVRIIDSNNVQNETFSTVEESLYTHNSDLVRQMIANANYIYHSTLSKNTNFFTEKYIAHMKSEN